jgi:hypothetical protein
LADLFDEVTLFDMTNNNLSCDKKKNHAFLNFWRPQFAYKIKKKKVAKCLHFLFSFDEKKTKVARNSTSVARIFCFHNKKRSKNAAFRQIGD